MWNKIEEILRHAKKLAVYVNLISLAIITIMWLFNIVGWQSVNGLFGVIGLMLVVFFAISPKVIQPSAALTGLIALIGKNNPVRGALQGPLWVVSVARSFLYGFLFFATFLTFWSFENAPFMFWGIFLIAIMLFIWRERYGSGGAWAKWLEWSYIIVCGIVLLWSTFGGAYTGKAFDPDTGKALYMVDPVTGNIDSHGRTPAECDQIKRKCFSSETGQLLRPMTDDEAIRRNPLTAPGAYASDAKAGVMTTVASSANKVATAGCPASVTASVESRPKTMLKDGCTTIVYWKSPGEAQFRLKDTYFDGVVNKYVKIVGTREVLQLTPRTGAFPQDKLETEVEILTEAEAAGIKTKIVASDNALIAEALK